MQLKGASCLVGLLAFVYPDTNQSIYLHRPDIMTQMHRTRCLHARPGFNWHCPSQNVAYFFGQNVGLTDNISLGYEKRYWVKSIKLVIL